MYTCGPSVYGDVHLGELRAYLMADWVRRALEMSGVRVEHVKGISDVSYAHRLELAEGEVPAEPTDEVPEDEPPEEEEDTDSSEQAVDMEAAEGGNAEPDEQAADMVTAADVEEADTSADMADQAPDADPEVESAEEVPEAAEEEAATEHHSYAARFHEDESKLNITQAEQFPQAVDHIERVVEMTQTLVEQNLAYEVQGNVFFSAFGFNEYGALSGRSEEQVGVEAVPVEGEPIKLDPRDFPLWDATQIEGEDPWQGPWGPGVPSRHSACSAITLESLGEQFDIHTGEADDVYPHHENEVAGTESYTGKRAASMWVNCQPLLVDGVGMRRSSDNVLTLADIEARGIEPLAFRYLCLTTRHTSNLNFTFRQLRAAQRGLLRLRNRTWELELDQDMPAGLSDADEKAEQSWRTRFQELLGANLDLPGALALMWELVRADLPSHTKLDLIRQFDEVLGLGLDAVSDGYAVPEDVQEILEQRDTLRHEAREATMLDTRGAAKTVRRSYQAADALRDSLIESGYVVEDTPTGTRVRPMYEWEWYRESSQAVSDPWEVRSWLEEPDRVDFSIVVVARNYIDDVSRCVQSALRWAGDRSVELIAIDNGSTDGTGEWLAETASKDPRVRATHLDHPVGVGAAKNLGLNQSAGRTILLLDPSVEVQGDLLRPIADLLSEETVGAVGAFGLRSTDLQQFDGGQDESGDADAIRGVCFAFRRALVPQGSRPVKWCKSTSSC